MNDGKIIVPCIPNLPYIVTMETTMDQSATETETRKFNTMKKDNPFVLFRYLTVLYFLSDVEEGGETAFPLADNETFDEDVSVGILKLKRRTKRKLM